MFETHNWSVGENSEFCYVFRVFDPPMHALYLSLLLISLPFVYQGKPTLSCLEYVLNFEHFDKSKTCTNVSDWIFENFHEATLLNGDFLQLAADGASNAMDPLRSLKAYLVPPV